MSKNKNLYTDPNNAEALKIIVKRAEKSFNDKTSSRRKLAVYKLAALMFEETGNKDAFKKYSTLAKKQADFNKKKGKAWLDAEERSLRISACPECRKGIARFQNECTLVLWHEYSTDDNYVPIICRAQGY